MPIVTSTYQANPTDDLGRMAIVERHIDHTGREHMVSYVCNPGLDPDVIMGLRAVRIGADIDKAEAEMLAAAGGEVVRTWTQTQYWKMFSPDELRRCEVLAQTDDNANYMLTVLRATPVIYANDTALIGGLQYFEAMGCINAGRAEAILNG
jgi:hypothetical protein